MSTLRYPPQSNGNISSVSFTMLLREVNQLNRSFQLNRNKRRKNSSLTLATSTAWINFAKHWDPARRRKGARTSSACFLHAPNPLLSSTCHTLAAKWNWLLISLLPQVSSVAGLQRARWEGLVRDRRMGGSGTTHRGNTQMHLLIKQHYTRTVQRGQMMQR